MFRGSIGHQPFPLGYEAAKASLDRSLARLDCGYIDLMLLHQPFNDVYGAWRALEEYQASGRIRAIGLSNFTADRVLDVGLFNKVMPAVDQIEISPFHQQTEQVQGLLAEGVVPEAWGPFAEGKFGIFENPVLTAIGQKYGKSVAQVVTRWLIERGIVVLAKSTKPERMAQNLNVFDFQLDDDDKAQIATLDVGKSQIISTPTWPWCASSRSGCSTSEPYGHGMTCHADRGCNHHDGIPG